MTPGRGQETNPAKEHHTSLYPARRELHTPRGGDAPLITYRANPAATPKAERAALAGALRYALACNQKRKAGARSTGDDAKEDKNARAETSLPG